MNPLDRISAIERSLPTGERKAILYRGNNHPHPVKCIPLEYLLYNPHNGRIRSYTKSYESQFHPLNPENSIDKNVIEQFLYDSAKNRNEKTLESLEVNGQQEVGIVTKDGVIIDGNRRAMLLNILSKRNKTPGFFNAIVLPDKLQDNEREIVTLETSYQMGVDSKVDYNPIEKYIRCKELNERHGLSSAEIAHIMAEEVGRIDEWLSILAIMDEYLIYLKTPQVYTRLEKKEGHFVDLHGYLKTYKKGTSSANWGYSANDLEELKLIYFDYIRLGIPVMRARIIAKPTANNSIFCNKEIWDEFCFETQVIMSEYQTPDFQEAKSLDRFKSNEDIIRNLDDIWRSNVGEQLHSSLSYAESLVKDRIDQIAPVKILKRAFNGLSQIEYHNLMKSDKGEVLLLLDKIQEKVDSLRDFVLSDNGL